MKLTNEMRNEFAEKVKKAIPRKCLMTKAKAIAAIEVRIGEVLPAEVKKLQKAYPGLLATQSQKVTLVPNGHGLGYLDWNDQHAYMAVPRIVDISSVKVDDIVGEYVEHVKEEAACEGLRQRTQSLAYSCTTLARLQELLPELVEHMPVESTKAFPIATTDNIISDLMKVGVKMAPKIKAPAAKKVAAKRAARKEAK